MGPIFALRSRCLTLKDHISGYKKVLDFWKAEFLYWDHTVTFRQQLKKSETMTFLLGTFIFRFIPKPSDNLS